jgi:hypothetical protein
LASGDTSLGQLGYSITGDFSDLQDALNQADSLAQTTGQSIADSLNVPGAGEELVTSLTGIGEAADEAISPLQDLGDETSALGSSGDDIASLSDAVTAVGSAADDAAPSLTDVSDAASELGDSDTDIEPLGDALSAVADAADEAAPSLTDVSDAAISLGDSDTDIEPLGDALSAVADSADEAAPSLTDVSDAASTLGDSDADIAPLGDALSAVSDAAQEAAPALADASDAVSELGDSADSVTPVSDALDAVSGSAEETTPALDDTAESASEVGENAEEAEGGLSRMAEALVQVGEALAATEALKEFGEEALSAYGTVQSVAIGLTSLTGSADQANEAIEQIKTLAATEPFAFPDIAPTIQRMVALGVSADQLQPTMQAVANTAAATGTTFNVVAQSLTRMALSGTANARQLASLGISTQQLGAAMGVTANQVTAAFKAMDQSQRIEAFDTALQKFAGDAEAQAQGISGQWQIFQNNFEEVMVAVGAALAPVVSSILQFGSTVMKEITSAIEAFNELPDPIRNTTVAIGVAVAAITPLALGASALVTAFGSLAAAGEPLVAGLTTLGLVARTTAEAEEAEAVAVESEGVAHEAAAVAIGESAVALEAGGAATAEAAVGAEEAGTAFSAFGLTLGPVAILIGGVAAALAAAKFTGIISDVEDMGQAFMSNAANLKVWEDDADSAIYDINAAINSGVTAVRDWVTGLTGVAAPLQQMQQYLPTVSEFVKQLAENMTGSNWIPVATASLTLLSGAVAEMNPLMAQAVEKLQAAAPAFALVKAGTDSLAASLTAVVAQQANANRNLAAAKQVLTDAATALSNGTISQSTYNRALADYQTALAAVTPKTKDFADSVAGITQAEQLAQEKAQSAIAVYNSVNTAFDQGTSSLGSLATAYSKAQSSAKAAGDAFATAAGQQALLNQSYNNSMTVYQANITALANLENEYNSGTLSATKMQEVQTQIVALYKTLGTESTTLGTSFYDQQAAMLSLTTEAGAHQTAIQGVITTYEGLQTQQTKTASSVEAADAAFKTISTDATALGLSVQQVGKGLVFTATSANQSNPQIVALATALTQAANAGLQFVTVNGQMVPIQNQMANATGIAAGQVGKLVTTADGATVAVIGLANAAPNATKAVTNLGTAAQGAATNHSALTASINAGTVALDPFSAAAVASSYQISAYGGAAATATQAQGNFTTAVKGSVSTGLDPFLASSVAATVQVKAYGDAISNGAQAVANADTINHTYNQNISAQGDLIAAQTKYTNDQTTALTALTAAGMAGADDVDELNDALEQDSQDLSAATNAAEAYTSALDAMSGAANAASSSVGGLDESMGDAASMSSSAYTLGAMGLNYLKNGELNLATDVPQTLNPESGQQIAAVNTELENLAQGLNADGSSTNALITSIRAADAATTSNTTATSANTTATSSNTTATTAATTATTAAMTATTALQAVNTELGTSFTDTGTALQTLETLASETGGSLNQTINQLISDINSVNAPLQETTQGLQPLNTQLVGLNTGVQGLADGVTSATSGLSILATGLSSTGQEVNNLGIVVGSGSGGLTQTLSGLVSSTTNANSAVTTWAQLLAADQSAMEQFGNGLITQAQWQAQDAANAQGYLNATSSAATSMDTAAGGAATALDSLASSASSVATANNTAASTTESVAQALATYMQGLETYTAGLSNAGTGAANTTQANQQALFANDQSLISAFTQATGLTLPNQGAAEVQVNPNLTYDPQTGLYTLAQTVAPGLTTNPNGTTTQQFLPGGQSAGPGETYTATGTTIQTAEQALAALVQNGGSFAGTGLGAGGSGGLTTDSSGYSQGVNYAAYAPTGTFAPTPATYSAGNPLPVTVTNGQPPQINITIPGATIIGTNGAQQLANVVQQQIITTLRQAGFKL